MPPFETPLYDVNLQQLSDAALQGQWRVSYRGPTGALALADPFSEATVLQLADAGTLAVEAPTAAPQAGQWQIERDSLLNRPYLSLALAPAYNTRALVTRLRRSADGQQRALTLYFASGMELSLVSG